MYNVLIGQSGGPTSAINATLSGIIEECLASPEIGTVYGAVNGIEGVLKDNIIDLTSVFAENTAEKLYDLSITPSSALGSCRKKLPSADTEEGLETYSKIFGILKKYNVGAFFYIGGNDSMDTVNKLSKIAEKFSSDALFIGVPKTIDNDLDHTDHTPGFGSAAKYIAATVQDIVMDCSVYTVKSVTLVEIMGRDSGWLTAASAIPTINGNGPDYVYLPEVGFDINKFIDDINLAHQKHPNVVICLSEGIRDKNGYYVGESEMSGKKDVFGHKYLSGAARYLEQIVRQRIGCKVRAFDLNLPQRCASYLISETDRKESIDSGRFSVRYMKKGKSGIMVSFFRRDDPYTIDFECVDIDSVANKVKTVPASFISESGNMVNERCIEYLLPLIKGEADLHYVNGIPRHFKLR